MTSTRIQKSVVSKNAKTIAKRTDSVKLSHGTEIVVPATTKVQKERQDKRREMVIITRRKAWCQGLSGMKIGITGQCSAKVTHD